MPRTKSKIFVWGAEAISSSLFGDLVAENGAGHCDIKGKLGATHRDTRLYIQLLVNAVPDPFAF